MVTLVNHKTTNGVYLGIADILFCFHSTIVCDFSI